MIKTSMPISLATTEHTDMPTLFLTREEETDASSARNMSTCW